METTILRFKDQKKHSVRYETEDNEGPLTMIYLMKRSTLLNGQKAPLKLKITIEEVKE